jgi:hypothetical protein
VWEWRDRSSNELGFILWRKKGTEFDSLASVGANGTSYIDTGLTESTDYSYKTLAYNDAGRSIDGDVSSSITTLAVSANSVPTFTGSIRTTLTADTLWYINKRFARLLTATDDDTADTTKILSLFEGVSTYTIKRQGGSSEKYRDKLTPIQVKVLSLLGLKVKDYWPVL